MADATKHLLDELRKIVIQKRGKDESLTETCKRVASELGKTLDPPRTWSASYFLSLLNGTVALNSRYVKTAIKRYLNGNKRRQYPDTITIRYPPIDCKPDPRRARALSLSMEQRRERLDKEST